MEPRRLPLGAVEADDGNVVIPPTTRADGSVRKEIRVRAGYVPQDEQPVYRPRGLRQQAAQALRPATAGGAVAAPTTPDDLSKHIDGLSLDDRKPTMADQTRRIPLGAVQTDAGDVVIPANLRADGSVRKEIRVRAGFVPQEEQPVYRPRTQRGKTDAPSTAHDLPRENADRRQSSGEEGDMRKLDSHDDPMPNEEAKTTSTKTSRTQGGRRGGRGGGRGSRPAPRSHAQADEDSTPPPPAPSVPEAPRRQRIEL
ncbi:Aste57867_21817 [Aphanomyces stellatus]|uniref:Aste57867_21817 protein n=1 Tax=Aphanomyces stellatus TaxID=120398 RepID=A0A485LKL2_9STRA|nr:hypothetical protein As57867_021748 [Aphanomyces stellatus]VFT98486.1 Aste57867_21817 [Aphanomyces stellatus]